MKVFRDNANRQWELSINIATVKRVKEVLGVDLLDFPDVFTQLAEDLITLCNVLFVLIQPQAEKAKVTDEDFGASMAGDSFENASMALMEEIINFFPQERRKILLKLKDKAQQHQEKVIQLAEAKLNSTDLDELLNKSIQTVSGS